MLSQQKSYINANNNKIKNYKRLIMSLFQNNYLLLTVKLISFVSMINYN